MNNKMEIESSAEVGIKGPRLPDGIVRTGGTCVVHGPYTVLTAKGRKGRCPVCAELRRAEMDKLRLEAVEKQKVAAKIAAIGIPPRYRGVEIDGFTAVTAVDDNARSRALRVASEARKYYNDWDGVRKKGRSMLFTGNPGTGKTMLACGLAADIVRRYRCSAVYASLLDIIADVRNTWACKQPDDQALRRYVDADLLIIDEVSACYGTNAERLILYRIVNKRYERVMPTILISNLTADETREAIGDPTWDRLRDGGGVRLVFDWPSLRGRDD